MAKIHIEMVLTIINNEIEVHESLSGESGKSKAFEEGFLAGLEHIRDIFDEFEVGEDDEADENKEVVNES